MVTFNETGFTVSVETSYSPQDNYKMTIDDIISVLQATDSDMREKDNYYYLLELLRAMMPDEQQIKKIITKK